MGKMKVPKDGVLQLRIDTPTLARFRTAAKAQGVTMSAVLRAAIGAVCAGTDPQEAGKGGGDERRQK